MGEKKKRKKLIWKNLRVSSLLSKEVRESLGMRIPVRIFVQDPLIAKNIRNLDRGNCCRLGTWFCGWPTNSRVAVVDYNVDTGIVARPVKWMVRGKNLLVLMILIALFSSSQRVGSRSECFVLF